MSTRGITHTAQTREASTLKRDADFSANYKSSLESFSRVPQPHDLYTVSQAFSNYNEMIIVRKLYLTTRSPDEVAVILIAGGVSTSIARMGYFGRANEAHA